MFEWDDGNESHIAEHGVESWEAEEAIQDRRRIPFSAVYEGRRGIVGRTGDGRLLVVIYEQTGSLIRVVTAYDASPREERSYRRARR
jgi:uncharacterized DUF497 family protein